MADNEFIEIMDFEHWLKDICAGHSYSKNFTQGHIKAEYDADSKVILMFPAKRAYSRQEIEEALYNEKKFKTLVRKMLD